MGQKLFGVSTFAIFQAAYVHWTFWPTFFQQAHRTNGNLLSEDKKSYSERFWLLKEAYQWHFFHQAISGVAIPIPNP